MFSISRLWLSISFKAIFISCSLLRRRFWRNSFFIPTTKIDIILLCCHGYGSRVQLQQTRVQGLVNSVQLLFPYVVAESFSLLTHLSLSKLRASINFCFYNSFTINRHILQTISLTVPLVLMGRLLFSLIFSFVPLASMFDQQMISWGKIRYCLL